MQKKKLIAFISNHYFNSKRKAGFQQIAQSCLDLGHDVLFITAPIGWANWLNNDHRFQYPIFKEKNKLITLKDGLYSYIHFTPLHAFGTGLPLVDKILWKIMKYYAWFSLNNCQDLIAKSDVIIMESTPAILLLDKLKSIAPYARFVYRVSDDLRLLRVNPEVVNFEERNIEKFDYVSAPSFYIFNKLSKFITKEKLSLDYHGLNKELFDNNYDNPYKKGTKNIVFVGNAYLDVSFIDMASELFSEYNFHIIGPLECCKKENVFLYGELEFKKTIPYLKFADIGLQTLTYRVGAESFTDSLKVIQYSYCGIVIIAPEFLKTNRKNTFYYQPDSFDSIENVVKIAMAYQSDSKLSKDINSWDELAMRLIK